MKAYEYRLLLVMSSKLPRSAHRPLGQVKKAALAFFDKRSNHYVTLLPYKEKVNYVSIVSVKFLTILR